MDDKTLLEEMGFDSRRLQMTTEEWIAPLKREIDELDRLLNEEAKLLGLPPIYEDYPASSKRR